LNVESDIDDVDAHHADKPGNDDKESVTHTIVSFTQQNAPDTPTTFTGTLPDESPRIGSVRRNDLLHHLDKTPDTSSSIPFVACRTPNPTGSASIAATTSSSSSSSTALLWAQEDAAAASARNRAATRLTDTQVLNDNLRNQHQVYTCTYFILIWSPGPDCITLI
jgi:hypothetical protein